MSDIKDINYELFIKRTKSRMKKKKPERLAPNPDLNWKQKIYEQKISNSNAPTILPIIDDDPIKKKGYRNKNKKNQ